jgi:hypothetical protein
MTRVRYMQFVAIRTIVTSGKVRSKAGKRKAVRL